MLIALSSRRAKKKVIGLKGSSYNNQEVFDITNANELIKISVMILFAYGKHLKENNSITILESWYTIEKLLFPHTLKLLLNKIWTREPYWQI